ncbi:MAG: hypothetical protein ACJ760_10325 [Thermoleophilaceae bacterium]
MERTLWTDERIDDAMERIDKRFDDVERRLDRIEDELIAIRRDMHNQLILIMFGQITGLLALAGLIVAHG